VLIIVSEYEIARVCVDKLYKPFHSRKRWCTSIRICRCFTRQLLSRKAAGV